ncbi:MAG: O-antigen ligase family protein [Fimbriimonadales bacterium]|nr:O-antigen ligase family protein [Fimbriimonadales bacterium]
MRVSEAGKRVRNGRIRLSMPLPRWLALGVGSQACALALAPWLAGSLYVGPRPVAPDEVLSGLLWTGDFPLMGALLVGVAVLIGLLACGWNVAMWRLPVGRVALPLALLLLWMGLSAVVNGSGWYGLKRLTEWGVAFALLLVITAVVRRGSSAWTIIVALIASATLIALRACMEYAVNRLVGIPNWRVFASFFNPNLLAGYLAMLIPLTMGVLLGLTRSYPLPSGSPRPRGEPLGERAGSPRPRGELQSRGSGSSLSRGNLQEGVRNTPLLTALLTVALWLQLGALALTGSRLGVLTGLGGVAVFLALTLWWRLLTRGFLLRLAVVGVLLLGVMWLSLPTAQRLTPQAATQDVHSGSFRLETWKGALRMTLANPLLGVGTGAFEWRYPPYASVGFTRLAHNSYLELASEAGIPALLMLLALGIGWLTRALQPELSPATDGRGQTGRAVSAVHSPPATRHLPFDWRPVRAGVVAGVLAGAAHNFVDTDLACFANLLTLAGLLGLGLALAVDGVYTIPLGVIERRGAVLVLSAALGMSLASMGLGELYANQARYDMLVGHAPQAAERLSIARTLDANNPDYLMDAGELYYALGRRDTAFTLMERAARLKPSPRFWYRLGLYYEREGKREQAQMAFEHVLRLDPNNLPAMLKLAQMFGQDAQATRLPPEALKYYERIVQLERSPYGRVRAVPEMVETAYGFAHLALARHYEAQGDLNRAHAEYEAALAVFRAYRERTLPFNRMGKELGLYNPEREQQILLAHRQALEGLIRLLEQRGEADQAATLREEYARLSEF